MHLLHRKQKEKRAASSLKEPGRTFVVVTTAALPWRTGTSINPMLRAAQLSAEPSRSVLLMVPWVSAEQQPLIYPEGLTFSSHAEQAEYILQEARKRTGLPCNFSVKFYAGKYYSSFGSIFPVEDIVKLVPREARDVAILEEPEHLCWFQHSSRWSRAFKHVVGILHTNYLAYIRSDAPSGTGFLNTAAVYRVNRWVCRIHCHKNVKLSDAVQSLPHQVTCNVHGVAAAFLDIGRAKAAKPPPGQHRFTKGAYFIGKAVWGKGYRELINMGAEYNQVRADPLVLDVIGSGEDLAAIQAAAGQKGLDWRWLGAKDHAEPAMHDYQVFLNPSTSDVVATTTAEALAMGKWAVVPDIACNAFFKQFRNCLLYSDAGGFVSAVDKALLNEPAPMSDEELNKLSWAAATQRLLEVGSMAEGDWPSAAETRYTAALWRMYRSIVGFTALREALGMTSPNDTDEPALDSEDLDEENEEDYEQQQQQAHAAAEAAAGAKRARDNSEAARAARAAAAQKELEEAKQLAGDEADSWDEDFQYRDL
ncbi:hypothetical protein OEZ86_007880 [Tetradesmus obliquus]|nr:hypothetical protein OEZ86_007880 [Tetradesmus obliquus]